MFKNRSSAKWSRIFCLVSTCDETFFHEDRQHVGYEETYHNEPEYCYSATLDEIEQKGWSLVPSKYIEFRNRDEQIDFDTKMRQLQAEMHDLLQQEETSKQELKALFEKLGYTL